MDILKDILARIGGVIERLESSRNGLPRILRLIGTPDEDQAKTLFEAIGEGGGGITPEQYNALAKEATLNTVKSSTDKIGTATSATNDTLFKAIENISLPEGVAQESSVVKIQQRLAVADSYEAGVISTSEATSKAQDHIRAVHGSVIGESTPATNFQNSALVRIKNSATDTDNDTELVVLNRSLVYGGSTITKSWQAGGQTFTASNYPYTGYGFTEIWLKDGESWIHYTNSLPSAQDNISTLHPALHTTDTTTTPITRTPTHVICLNNPN